MTRSRLLIVPLAIAAVLLTGCVPERVSAEPVPWGTSTTWRSPTPTATPTPTPTPTVQSVEASCDTISTDAHRTQMTADGWTSAETQDDITGVRPFDGFPNGAPSGQVICQWSPEPATGAVLNLAWASIDPENAIAAENLLAQSGYTRMDAPEGIYLLQHASGQPADAEGWASSYLFTTFDVRWAATKADLARVTSPLTQP